LSSDVSVNLAPPTDPAVARVVENRLATKGKSASFIHHLAFDVAGTPLAGHVTPGQSLGVLPPGRDERGRPHKIRLYSSASPSHGEDGAGNVFATPVKRAIAEEGRGLVLGVCSNYLCDLTPGDLVRLTGPSGRRFLLPKDVDAHDYVFVATGTGVAPYRGFLLELLRGKRPTRRRVHLVMGTGYTTDLIYDDLFKELAADHSTFSYHTAISREPRDGTDRGLYVHELMAQRFDLFGEILASSTTLLYCCGISGMEVGLYRLLAANELADGYVRVPPELASLPPEQWDHDLAARTIKPTDRCLLEVY
jgi:ferredoxin--NADP+ reductase